MEQLSWDLCRSRIDELGAEAEPHLNVIAKYIQMYRGQIDNEDQLAQILAELNYRVLETGDLQAKVRRIDLWTDKRYEMEKSFAALKVIREGKAVNYAKEAKYEGLEKWLDTMVDASALHLRLQNGRSSARDTTEAIRSRISQLKGAQRSS